jgi:hypothetical protein
MALNPGGILTTRPDPKYGRYVQIWLSWNGATGLWTSVCPELPRIGGRDADPDVAYRLAKQRAAALITSCVGSKKPIPWQSFSTPPSHVKVRRFLISILAHPNTPDKLRKIIR